MRSVTVGVAIASRNEAVLLGRCLDACLDATSGADEVVVFDLASVDGSADVARSRGVRVITLDAVPYVELIRGAQLAAVDTDWLLFLDPDEILPAGWLAQARQLVTAAGPDVGAYWIAYDEVAFGRRLEHTRAGAAKVALVRREHAAAAVDPQPHTPLQVRGATRPVAASLPRIDHHGYRSVAESIGKLSRYAVNGGVGIDLPGPPAAPLTGITLLWRAIVMDRAWRDGSAGVAVATLSAVGDLLGGLQRWDAAGRPEARAGRRTAAALGVGRLASRAQWAARRSPRRSTWAGSASEPSVAAGAAGSGPGSNRRFRRRNGSSTNR